MHLYFHRNHHELILMTVRRAKLEVDLFQENPKENLFRCKKEEKRAILLATTNIIESLGPLSI